MIRDIMDHFRKTDPPMSDDELGDKFSELSDLADRDLIRLKDLWHYYKAHSYGRKEKS
jgi:hypothetical protein